MSILIKGMEMPTKHFIKGFYIDGETGNILDISRKSIIGHAVEVPTPHGRLIDADKLEKEILRAWNLWEKKGEDCYLFADVITPMLINQITVIEREG